MDQHTTLEHPAEIAQFLTQALGKEKIKNIKFGYRLENEEPAIKFKIILRFPYNLFAKKKVEEMLQEEISHIKLAASMPSRLLFHIA